MSDPSTQRIAPPPPPPQKKPGGTPPPFFLFPRGGGGGGGGFFFQQHASEFSNIVYEEQSIRNVAGANADRVMAGVTMPPADQIPSEADALAIVWELFHMQHADMVARSEAAPKKADWAPSKFTDAENPWAAEAFLGAARHSSGGASASADELTAPLVASFCGMAMIAFVAVGVAYKRGLRLPFFGARAREARPFKGAYGAAHYNDLAPADTLTNKMFATDINGGL